MAVTVRAESPEAPVRFLAYRAFLYWVYQFKRTWRGALGSSISFPLLYLTAMGVGLGSLVDRHLGASGLSRIGGVPYLSFVAPGVLAASAMQTALAESTYPVLSSIKWTKVYKAMLATPIRVKDVLLGHLGFISLRLMMTCGVFAIVASMFGVFSSPQAVLVFPIGVFAGLAFSLPIVAFAATQERDIGFTALFRLIFVPLFLFSGCFFPVSQLPGALQVIAELTPLYHAVCLCRAASTGVLVQRDTLGHLAYLLGLLILGYRSARLCYERRLWT